MSRSTPPESQIFIYFSKYYLFYLILLWNFFHNFFNDFLNFCSISTDFHFIFSDFPGLFGFSYFNTLISKESLLLRLSYPIKYNK